MSDSPLLDAYYAACDKYKVSYDPIVVTVVMTEWSTLYRPMKDFSHALPICDILMHPDASFITSVDLGSNARHHYRRDGDMLCRLLRRVLQKNQTLKTLRLGRLGITICGVRELCYGLEGNSGLVNLYLNGNYLDEHECEDRLVSLVKQPPPCLNIIDLSYCSLGSSRVTELWHALGDVDPSMNAVKQSEDSSVLKKGLLRSEKLQVLMDGNSEIEELYNSITHGVGIIISVVGSFWMFSLTFDEPDLERRQVQKVSLLVYFCSLLLMYVSSTLLHGFYLLPTVEQIFKVLDHLSIYVLIAGSYTPIYAINMLHTSAGFYGLIAEWTLCFVGCFAYVIAFHFNVTEHVMVVLVELLFYVAMGWGVVVNWSAFNNCVSLYTRNLIAIGGVFYTVGIFFFVRGKRVPIYHVAWHVFVLVASVIQFFGIRDILNRPTPSTCIGY